MAEPTIQVRIRGLEAVADGFDAMIRQLHAELRPGFIPEARYRGLGGLPFALIGTERAARQAGFVIRGEGF